MLKILPKDLKTKVKLQKLKSSINLENLPDDLRISTITVTCKFDTEFLVKNIGRYIDLSPERFLSVKYGDSTNSIRSLMPQKSKKPKKSRKKRKAFYNQATIEVKSHVTGKKTNVKLFKNGSIQMTGCKGVLNFIEVLEKICFELTKKKGVLDMNKNCIELKPFATNPKNLRTENVKDVNIRMINSNFNLNFHVDRERLYTLLLSKGIECTFEPCVHAAVNIKYHYKKDERVSIFVFEKGSIIITGAKTREHIVKAYEFITTTLLENYNQIVSSGLDQFIKRKEIQDLLKEYA